MSIIENYFRLFTQPRLFFDGVRKSPTQYTYAQPLQLYLIVFLLGLLITSVLTLFSGHTEIMALFDGMHSVSPVVLLVASTFMLVVGVLFSLAIVAGMTFVMAALHHIGVRLFKAKGSYMQSYIASVYALSIFVPYSVAGELVSNTVYIFISHTSTAEIVASMVTVPFFIVGIVHVYYAISIGMSMMHKMSVGKALIGCLLVPIALFVAVMLIFALLVALFAIGFALVGFG